MPANREAPMSAQIRSLYASMPDRLARARKSFGRPLTLTEKILASHAWDFGAQVWDRGKAILKLRVDRVALQDVTGQMALFQFMMSGRKRVAVPSTVHCDHLIRAESGAAEDLHRAIRESEEVYNFIRSAARKYGMGFWRPGSGIIHQVVLENYATPGTLMIAADSHTPNAGGLGMLAIGVGGADCGEAMAAYLRATDRGDLAALAEEFRPHLVADPEVADNPATFYDELVEIKLDTLEPHIVGPHSPDRGRPISRLAAEVRQNGWPAPITNALIGSCTNSAYEDMRRAAHVAMQGLKAGLKAKAKFRITPGSERIYQTIKRDGLMDTFEKIGGTVLANACGPCIGQWKPTALGPNQKNTIVSSFNRNFPGRNDGSQETLSFITSPDIVTALAFAGTLEFNPLTDTLTAPNGERVRFTPPEGEELPRDGFARGAEGYEEPAADPDSVRIEVPENSERLQLLGPFVAWDGKDFIDLPILVKTKGKTTTDHISPAGPWLKYRGHLDKISDNMFLGANNAFFSELGKGTDVLAGESGLTIAQIARRYKAKGIGSAVVGDENYGEGSSREHAAMSPRYLGVKVVVTKSFARIHETNLKKQGILALTFADPKDYDQIEQTDRISVVDLQHLKP